MILNLNHRYFNERGYTCVCYIWISLPSWSFSDMELLALFVSSLGHDLDHRGTNNQYQMSSVSKARPPTSMDYLVCFTCSWYASHIQCPIYIHVPVQETFCMQGYFCPLRLLQNSYPFQMAFLMIKLYSHFKFVHWQRERILAKLNRPPKCPCIQFVHVYNVHFNYMYTDGYILGEI